MCATHRDLEAEVAAGRFRADLLFRLREVTLDVPPLAARGDDIVLLAHAFLRQAERQLGLALHTLTDDAQAALRAHPWPGNVRELKATMRRVAVLADSQADPRRRPRLRGDRRTARRPRADGSVGLARVARCHDRRRRRDPAARDAARRARRRYVELAVERCDGDRDAAAKALEIGVRTLYRYLS